MKTLLAIGDNCDFEAFKKFRKLTQKSKGFSYLNINYKEALSRKLPKIESDELIIFLFFPFDYWNSKIEPKNYKGVYGSQKFYSRFVDVCKRIEKNIKQAYKGKKIAYIIPPNLMYYDRDKELTKRILEKAGVNAPKAIRTRSI